VAVDAKADGEAPATWVRVALFGDAVGALAPRLTKGAEVYCEGRLSLGTWMGRDGEAKARLNLAAWVVPPMGQIGRRKPKVQSRDEYERPHEEQDAVPFDDPLRF
jgi:single-stranded DNA-binding protein